MLDLAQSLLRLQLAGADALVCGALEVLGSLLEQGVEALERLLRA